MKVDFRADRSGRRALSRGHGFTIVELLVVIAIMALLATMLLPALGAARNRTRTVMCQTNLHLQSNMMQQYAADCKDFLPSPATSHGMSLNNNDIANYSQNSFICVSTDSKTLLQGAYGAGTVCTDDPAGNGATFPVNAGWYFWQGYAAPPAGTAMRNPLPLLQCPDSAAAYDGFTNMPTNKTQIQTNSAYIAQLAINFSRQSTAQWVTPGVHYPNCDNKDQVAMSEYVFRGYRNGGKVVPRISSWKPSMVYEVDRKSSYRMADYAHGIMDNNLNKGHGEAGMNLLYFDGHAAFGAANLATTDLVNQAPASIPPYIYQIMKWRNETLANVMKLGEDSGGRNYYFDQIWAFYDTGIR